MPGTEIDDKIIIPRSIPDTIDKMEPNGIYLINNG